MYGLKEKYIINSKYAEYSKKKAKNIIKTLDNDIGIYYNEATNIKYHSTIFASVPTLPV